MCSWITLYMCPPLERLLSFYQGELKCGLAHDLQRWFQRLLYFFRIWPENTPFIIYNRCVPGVIGYTIVLEKLVSFGGQKQFYCG